MSKHIILFTFLHGLVFTVAKEPSCSSFDFEQRLLERVLRNELALENLLKEIKETNVKVTGVLADVDEKRTTLNSALEKAKHDIQNIVEDYRHINKSIIVLHADADEKRTTLNSALHDIQNIVEDYRHINKSISVLHEKALATPIIYFRARTPPINSPLSIGQIVVFTRVEVNEGQGYDKVNGKFTAPVAGLYIFSVQFCAETNKWAYLAIIQDDKFLQASAHYGPDNNEECATFQVFTAVGKGNKVWVKVTYPTELYEQEIYRYTSFSGVLIRS